MRSNPAYAKAESTLQELSHSAKKAAHSLKKLRKERRKLMHSLARKPENTADLIRNLQLEQRYLRFIDHKLLEFQVAYKVDIDVEIHELPPSLKSLPQQFNDLHEHILKMLRMYRSCLQQIIEQSNSQEQALRNSQSAKNIEQYRAAMETYFSAALAMAQLKKKISPVKRSFHAIRIRIDSIRQTLSPVSLSSSSMVRLLFPGFIVEGNISQTLWNILSLYSLSFFTQASYVYGLRRVKNALLVRKTL